MFENTIRDWMSSNRLTKEAADELAEVLNVFTGRGDFRAVRGDLGKVMNAAFFAPRFTISRFRAPTMLATVDDPNVRRFVAGQLGAFVATGMGALGLMAAAHRAGIIPGFSLESDPRSSDFGKGRVGAVRFDFWGGYQQIARTFARAATGQQKTSSGRIVDINRLEDAIWNQFVRSKTSPQTGFLWNATTGENFIGDKVTTPEGVADQLKSSFVPLAVQDTIEGFEEASFKGALSTSPALLGVGVTSYRSLGEVREEAAQRVFSKPYEELTGGERRIIEQDPKVVDKLSEFDLKAGDSFSDTVDDINAQRIAEERVISANLVSGGFRSRREFADAIEQAQLKSAILRQEAAERFELPEPDPTSPLSIALSAWYDLFEQADRGAERGVITGQVDWEKFDQLERDLFAQISPQQREFIEQRAKPDHDPTIQWYFDNKEYVNNSKYYDVTDEIFDQFRGVVQRLFPQVESYSDLLKLQTTAATANDRVTERRAKTLINRISSRVSKRRERMRKLDPNLDRALFEIGRTTVFLTPKARNLGRER